MDGGVGMPARASKQCRYRACVGIVKASTDTCTIGHPQTLRADDVRESASQRGYGARWRKQRAMYLSAHPLCVDPFGVHPSQVVAATDVDHIVARRCGGSDHESNLQALCHSCHSIKTNREMSDGEGRVKSLETSEQRPVGQESSRGREFQGAF